MANNIPIDRTKKSNIKCEHCVWWDRNSDDYIFENNAWKYPCNNNKGYKAYWNRCKAFEWKSEIKKVMDMENDWWKRLDDIEKEEYIRLIYGDEDTIIKKQIPKKPIMDIGYDMEGNAWNNWRCPCCRSTYLLDDEEYDYCPNCGQKIDFGKE